MNKQEKISKFRQWILAKLGGMPYVDYHAQAHGYEILNECISSSIERTMKDHPKYRQTTLDKYIFTSYSKRFLGLWIDKINRKSLGFPSVKNPND
jgi:hypothetical protein